jgi:hypothetical protein
MAAKRRRAPGGGRKPKAGGAGATPAMSIRVPAELRAQLEAAQKRSGRKSLSDEMLARLNKSFSRDRDKATDPAMRALNFLFSTLAYSLHWNIPNWRSDPFLFKAIKIGICKLLDALEPSGEATLPDFWQATAASLTDEPASDALGRAVREDILKAIQSPETMADYAVRMTLHAYLSPRTQNWEALRGVAGMPGEDGEIGDQVLKHQENQYYGMKDAKRDLAIKGEMR